jgi:hypothetical protein
MPVNATTRPIANANERERDNARLPARMPANATTRAIANANASERSPLRSHARAVARALPTSFTRAIGTAFARERDCARCRDRVCTRTQIRGISRPHMCARAIVLPLVFAVLNLCYRVRVRLSMRLECPTSEELLNFTT